MPSTPLTTAAFAVRLFPFLVALLVAPTVYRTLLIVHPVLLAAAPILPLAALSALAGTLPLASISSPRVDSIIDTLLALFVALPVLHIPSKYAYIHRAPLQHHHSRRVILNIAHTCTLVIALSSATILALLPPAHPLYLQSAALAIVFCVLALVRLITALYQLRDRTTALCAAALSIPLTLPSHPRPGNRSRYPSPSITVAAHAKSDSVDSDDTVLGAHCDPSTPRGPTSPRITLGDLSSPATRLIRPDQLEQDDSILRDQLQILFHRSRSLFILFASAQLALLFAHSLSFPLALQNQNNAASFEILFLLKSISIIVAVTGTMAGYLFHAYNASFFVDQSPSPSSSESSINLSAYNHPFARRYLSSSADPSTPHHHPSGIVSSSAHHVQLVDSRPQQVVTIQLSSPPMMPRRKRLGLPSPPPSAMKRCASIFRPTKYKDDVLQGMGPLDPPSRHFVSGLVAGDSADELSPMEIPKEGDSLLLQRPVPPHQLPSSDAQSPIARLAYADSPSPTTLSDSTPFLKIKDQHHHHRSVTPRTVTKAIFESDVVQLVEQPTKRHSTLGQNKRAAVPPPAATRKLLGWEFGRDPLPHVGKESRFVRSLSIRRGSDAATTTATNNSTAADPSSVPVKDVSDRKVDEGENVLTSKKQKRFTQPPMQMGDVSMRSSHPATSHVSPPRKIRRTSVSHEELRPMSTDSGVVIPGEGEPKRDPPARDVDNNTLGLEDLSAKTNTTIAAAVPPSLPPVVVDSNLSPATASSSSPSAVSPLPSPLITPTTAHHNMMAMFRGSLAQSSVSRPSMSESVSSSSASSEKYSKEAMVVSKGGLRLRKSFKMGVGRTLGPGLTLAAASGPTSAGSSAKSKSGKGRVLVKKVKRQSAMTTSSVATTVREWVRMTDDASKEVDGEDDVRARSDEDMDEDRDEDVGGDGDEDEIRSIVAARLVSASYARATTASTIIAAPVPGTATTSRPGSMEDQAGSSRPVGGAPIAATKVVPDSVTSPSASTFEWELSSHPFAGPSIQFPSSSSSRHPIGARNDDGGNGRRGGRGAEVDESEDYEVVTLEMGMEEGLQGRGSVDQRDEDGDDDERLLKLPMEVYGMSLPAITVQAAAPTTPPQPQSQSQSRGLASWSSPTSSRGTSSGSYKTPDGSPTGGMMKTLKKQRSRGWLGSTINREPSSTPQPATTPILQSSSLMPDASLFHSTTTSAAPSPCPSPSPQPPSRFPMIFGISSSSLDRSRPSTPKGGLGSSLSKKLGVQAKKMDTVRNAFAGVVGARVGGRNPVSNRGRKENLADGPSAMAYGYGCGGESGQFDDAEEGDFMDLRDPFASPVMLQGAIRRKTEAEKRESSLSLFQNGQDRHVYGTTIPTTGSNIPRSSRILSGSTACPSSTAIVGLGRGQQHHKTQSPEKRKIDAQWGRLPLPVRGNTLPNHPTSSSALNNTNSSSSPSKSHRAGTLALGSSGAFTSSSSSNNNSHGSLSVNGLAARVVGAGRKKSLSSKRARKRTLSGFRGLNYPQEDPDGAVALEEALLTQQLLSRLDDDDWEGRY